MTARDTGSASGRPLAEWTDAELAAELQRRRAARAARRAESAGTVEGPAGTDEASAERRRIAQCYANLELPQGAPLERVQAAYRELVGRYHPDRHAGDPERHRAATELLRSLTEAYETLVRYLQGGRG
ncbi:MAG: J domain-containing protein [Myxococcota bacterium]|nr:J domain-containing protein [Myxococcota bacterium]MDW8361889.1 J domain-containing protein [Myxococcales bacterium]